MVVCLSHGQPTTIWHLPSSQATTAYYNSKSPNSTWSFGIWGCIQNAENNAVPSCSFLPMPFIRTNTGTRIFFDSMWVVLEFMGEFSTNHAMACHIEWPQRHHPHNSISIFEQCHIEVIVLLLNCPGVSEPNVWIDIKFQKPTWPRSQYVCLRRTETRLKNQFNLTTCWN